MMIAVKEEHHHYILSAFIILLIVVHHVLNPLNIDINALKAITVALMMIALWILEIIPMPVVALLPLIIFPLWKMDTLQNTAKNYADPIIFLFMGGFFLAIAIEKWNLHQRIALNILKKSGSNGNQILLGFMLSTFLLSMWLSNTATTLMMFPIALSILNVMSHSYSKKTLRNFSIALLLSIAYAANIGGISTIIGTPPNTAFVGFMNDQLNSNISFLQWFLIAFPIALIILLILYLMFIKVLFKNDIKQHDETESYIQLQLSNLGTWTKAEKRVFFVFLITAFLWMAKDPINSITGLALNDTIIAMMAGISLFALPAGITMQDSTENRVSDEENPNSIVNLLEWQDTKKMAWGILLLFGGGLALAKSLEDAGVMKMIGDSISRYAPDNRFLLILIVATISIFLSEVMSNIAQVIVMAPILTSVALAMNIPPIILGLPMTLAASCAGMLPMGTPPNAIIYSSGQVPLQKMLKAGFVLNLISILVISVICYVFTTIVFR
jgi:solute carrier family 13 (sodium-dependent dicarboxylate transporter), member 2/3/5